MAVAEEAPQLSRWEQREAQRKAAHDLARSAAHARAAKKSKADIGAQVQAAQKQLAGTNVSGAINLIESQSSTGRDIFLLAEEFGLARKGVLRGFGPVRSVVRAAYVQTVGESPNQTPQGAKE